MPHLFDEAGHDGSALLKRRFFGAEVAVEAQKIEFQAIEIVVLAEFANEREFLRPHFGNGKVLHEVCATY